MYVLNAAVLSKPGAVNHLAVDLKTWGPIFKKILGKT